MRISFILASLWLSGGERIVVELANRLSANGHAVSLVIPGGTIDPEMAREVMPNVNVQVTRTRGTRKMRLPAMTNLAWALATAVPPSDVIITTYTPTTPAGWIAAKLLRRGRLVWFYQDFPEMFENRPLYGWLARRAAHWHECILTISNSLMDDLRPFAGRTPMYMIGEALSRPDIYHPYSDADLIPASGGRRVLLYLGDHRPRKGLADFLSAAQMIHDRYPEIELWLALKDSTDVDTSICKRVFFHPKHEELARLYASCDVYISSTLREGFGLPPLEAMACGAAVVMTNSGGGLEYARDEENCLLVPPGSPAQLSQAVLRVLEDSALEEKLRRNGPPTAAKFNWETVIARCEQALQDFRQN